VAVIEEVFSLSVWEAVLPETDSVLEWEREVDQDPVSLADGVSRHSQGRHRELCMHHWDGRSPCTHRDNSQPPRPLHRRHLRRTSSCSTCRRLPNPQLADWGRGNSRRRNDRHRGTSTTEGLRTFPSLAGCAWIWNALSTQTPTTLPGHLSTSFVFLTGAFNTTVFRRSATNAVTGDAQAPRLNSSAYTPIIPLCFPFS
jgi:hypothetical protein